MLNSVCTETTQALDKLTNKLILLDQKAGLFANNLQYLEILEKIHELSGLILSRGDSGNSNSSL